MTREDLDTLGFTARRLGCYDAQRNRETSMH